MARPNASIALARAGNSSYALPVSGDQRIDCLKAAEHKRKPPVAVPRPVSPTRSVGSEQVLGSADEISFLRLPEVKAVTGLSKTSVYTLIRDQNFPAPVRLGPRAVAWVRSEVNQWAAERVLSSRTAGYEAAPKPSGSVRGHSSDGSKRLA